MTETIRRPDAGGGPNALRDTDRDQPWGYPLRVTSPTPHAAQSSTSSATKQQYSPGYQGPVEECRSDGGRPRSRRFGTQPTRLERLKKLGALGLLQKDAVVAQGAGDRGP